MKFFAKVALVCALSFVGLQASAFEATDGKDYRVVNPTVDSPRDTIEVVDFFAYTCAHCQRLAPMLQDWAKTLPPDVTVKRVPVAWEPATQFLSQIYYTFEALDRLDDLHPAFWQDILDGQITSQADLQNWLEKHKVDLTQWNNAYNSFAVTMHTQQALQAWTNYLLDATPYVAVAGKSLTPPQMAGPRHTTLKVLNRPI